VPLLVLKFQSAYIYSNVKMAVFRDVVPCRLVEVYQCFRGAWCLHTMMVEAAGISEMFINFYQTTWCKNAKAAVSIPTAMRTSSLIYFKHLILARNNVLDYTKIICMVLCFF
jgi:hypothetical protein